MSASVNLAPPNSISVDLPDASVVETFIAAFRQTDLGLACRPWTAPTRSPSRRPSRWPPPAPCRRPPRPARWRPPTRLDDGGHGVPPPGVGARIVRLRCHGVHPFVPANGWVGDGIGQSGTMKSIRLRDKQGTLAAAPPPLGVRGQRRQGRRRLRRDGACQAADGRFLAWGAYSRARRSACAPGASTKPNASTPRSSSAARRGDRAARTACRSPATACAWCTAKPMACRG